MKERTPCSIDEDMSRPLQDVYRWYLRVPIAIIFIPIVAFIWALGGVIDWFEDVVL